MAEKVLNTRIIHKHDTEENWRKAQNFIPKQGELIVYDIDATHGYERIKMGDGKTLVNNLPFISSGNGILVDDALSISGAAADAKVTGDAIGQLKGDVSAKQDKPTAQGDPGQVLGLNTDMAPTWIDQKDAKFVYIDKITLEEDSILNIALPYACSKVFLSGQLAVSTDNVSYFVINGSSYSACAAAVVKPSTVLGNNTYSALIEVWDVGIMRCSSGTSVNVYTASPAYISQFSTDIPYVLSVYKSGIQSLVSSNTFKSGSTIYIYGVKK